MKKIKLVFIVIIITNISWGQASKINGISFVGGRNVVNETSIQPVLDVNANWVTLMPLGFMRDLSSTTISFDRQNQWWGERKIGVITTANLFHKNKIKVMIKPQIWVSRGKFTGYISMESEEEWKAFEKTYESFILDFAILAQEIKAELFCLGTELNKFVTTRSEFWNQLIKKVKKVYKGKLTYAENWDKFDKVPFWNQIDYLGIDAYFPLSKSKTPLLEELKTEWARHKEKIIALQKQENIPVLFTEYGYRSIDFNTEKPWNSDRNQTNVNLKAQEIALKALFNEFWPENWFAGGFLWKWYDYHERAGGSKNSRFTPQNKPAEKLIKEFYGTRL